MISNDSQDGILPAKTGRNIAHGRLVQSLTSVILTILFVMPLSDASQAFAQNGGAASAPTPVTNPPAASQSYPDSPMPAIAQSADPQSPGANQQQANPQPANQQQTTPPSLGTAAAPVESPVGVPASRPAGAAIAPARQKRTRSFAIRIAILAGVAVGIGTVLALSNASPNRPQ